MSVTQYAIPYGKGEINFELPGDLPVAVIRMKPAAAEPTPLSAVARAIRSPVGGVTLEQFATARSVAIAISDKTRPVPHQTLLPPLLGALSALGLAPEKITLVIATGTHVPMDASEFASVVPPEILSRYRVECHHCDADDLVAVGTTHRGTEVLCNKTFATADLRLVVGNIEPHQFAGFSGGVKTAAIGLAGRGGINHNHALMMHPNSQIGVYEANPLRQDIEEMGALMGVHLALNAILNEEKHIVHVLFGEPKAVMAHGIPLAKAVCLVDVGHEFDLLIVSPGGHPKDINLYQAQKALGHAMKVMREGGTVILAAACPEGSGSAAYEAWMRGKHSYEEILSQFHAEGFRIGPHKAFQIARDASRITLKFVSDMPRELADYLLLNPTRSFDDALQSALSDLPPRARIGIMPVANATIPLLGVK